MTFVVIDIETVESPSAKSYYAAKRYSAPSNYKDPAKIEAAILEKRQADMESAALHWWTGKIVCIGAMLMDGGDTSPLCFYGDDEAKTLCLFFDWLTLNAARGSVVLGKSADLFDVPYLIGRAMAHDLGVPEALRKRTIEDVDHIFNRSSQCAQRSSLGNYAFGLGIAGKTGLGSDVGDLYAMIQMGDDSKWHTLSDYCANDVKITAELLRRYLKPYVVRHPPPKDDLSDIPF